MRKNHFYNITAEQTTLKLYKLGSEVGLRRKRNRVTAFVHMLIIASAARSCNHMSKLETRIPLPSQKNT